MNGWLLILALLVLGGVLSTLGDRLGSRVGKARLSLFNLRPRQTAVVITVLTGSLISALSLGLMLLVSQQLRIGLFELDEVLAKLQSSRDSLKVSRLAQSNSERDLQQAKSDSAHVQIELKEVQKRATELRNELAPLQKQRQHLEAERTRLSHDISQKDADIQRTEIELANVRSTINAAEKELKQLESNLIALRRGAVVLSSGQQLAAATLRLENPSQARDVINRLLQEANQEAFRRVRPGEEANRQILLVPRSDIKRIEQIIRKPGTWVVNVRSAANVLRGENIVYAFPDVRSNITVVRQAEVLARTTLDQNEQSAETVRNRLNLLLASTLAEVKRRGSLSTGLQFDGSKMNQLAKSLLNRPKGQVELEAIALRNSDTADPVAVVIQPVGNQLPQSD
ncbi:MAG: DUF3084 domain-containing protein [Prochlorococcaceae cyanobacterium ETNP18_MAG_17]|nr:DUF3084 domain-containing protein [Prochlorococcaceae cyanobacterium ETNP18_MAG_17]